MYVEETVGSWPGYMGKKYVEYVTTAAVFIMLKKRNNGFIMCSCKRLCL